MGRLVRFGLGLWSEPGKLRQAIGLRQEIGGRPLPSRLLAGRGGRRRRRSARSRSPTAGRPGRSTATTWPAASAWCRTWSCRRLLGCALEAGSDRRGRVAADDRARCLLRGGGDRDRRARPGAARRADRRPGRRRASSIEARALFPARDKARQFADVARTVVRPPRRASPPGPARHDRLPLRGRPGRRPAGPDLLGRRQAPDPLRDGPLPGPDLRSGDRLPPRMGARLGPAADLPLPSSVLEQL